MDIAKGTRSLSPHVRASRHVSFTTVLQPAQALRRLRCWAICPAADDLELEEWMVAGSIDG
jgi:hypothetical protein